MNEHRDDDLIQLSAIQHIAFCPRQCYLGYVEQQWQDNFFTAAGEVMHERVDSNESGYVSPGIRQVRSLVLRSYRYGVSGRADLVEFDEKRNRVYPVEYKLGKPKANDCDAVQLCAQALCLEEMLNVSIPFGAIYYGKPKRRMEVELTPELRANTVQRIQDVHDLLKRPSAPPPLESREKCALCSLQAICLPELFDRGSPLRYLEHMVKNEEPD